MRFVELKAAAQLDMQTLHRARDRLIGTRTALINQLRAILLERGITMPRGRRKLQRQLTLLLEDCGLPISSRMMALVEDMRAQWAELDRRLADLDDEMVQSARTDEAARRLISVPGIGALNATALLAAVGDGGTFARARDLAAWLGLVPRQVTTGGRPRLVGITKRGNSYLRRLLIHGARAALPGLAASETPLGTWLQGLLSRTHKNAVVVALANKLARIAWAVLRRGERFHGGRVAAA
jgi:transposase